MSQTVERALRVLDHLAEAPSTIDQVAEALGVHPTTALRTLQVLEARRIVVRDERHVFRLGSGLFALANAALERIDLRSAAGCHLDELNRTVGHTVHLAALEGDNVVYIDKRESLNPVRLWSRIGHIAPVHCTALAKAILAYLPHDERRRLSEAATFERFTERTISGLDELLADLDRTAARGYALDHLEHEEFVNCMASPILGPDHRVLGAVSITTTTLSCTYEQLLEFQPILAETTLAISAEFGWRPGDPGLRAVATVDSRALH